jgi:signal transduction histidine kinase
MNRLCRLVDNLLDVTRITRNKIVLRHEHVDVNDLARRVAEDQRSLFDVHEIGLDVELAPDEVFVHGDGVRLAQAASNLPQNAVKFTPRGGSARVRVARDPQGQQALIHVCDSGTGMDRQTVGRLFQPFAQAEATLDRSQGKASSYMWVSRGRSAPHQGHAFPGVLGGRAARAQGF